MDTTADRDDSTDAPRVGVTRENGEIELQDGDETEEQRGDSELLEEHRRPTSAPIDPAAAQPFPDTGTSASG
jgi:hypothetical protein